MENSDTSYHDCSNFNPFSPPTNAMKKEPDGGNKQNEFSPTSVINTESMSIPNENSHLKHDFLKSSFSDELDRVRKKILLESSTSPCSPSISERQATIQAASPNEFDMIRNKILTRSFSNSLKRVHSNFDTVRGRCSSYDIKRRSSSEDLLRSQRVSTNSSATKRPPLCSDSQHNIYKEVSVKKIPEIAKKNKNRRLSKDFERMKDKFEKPSIVHSMSPLSGLGKKVMDIPQLEPTSYTVGPKVINVKPSTPTHDVSKPDNASSSLDPISPTSSKASSSFSFETERNQRSETAENHESGVSVTLPKDGVYLSPCESISKDEKLSYDHEQTEDLRKKWISFAPFPSSVVVTDPISRQRSRVKVVVEADSFVLMEKTKDSVCESSQESKEDSNVAIASTTGFLPYDELNSLASRENLKTEEANGFSPMTSRTDSSETYVAAFGQTSMIPWDKTFSEGEIEFDSEMHEFVSSESNNDSINEENKEEYLQTNDKNDSTTAQDVIMFKLYADSPIRPINVLPTEEKENEKRNFVDTNVCFHSSVESVPGAYEDKNSIEFSRIRQKILNAHKNEFISTVDSVSNMKTRSLTDSVLDERLAKESDASRVAYVVDDTNYYSKVKQKLEKLHKNDFMKQNNLRDVSTIKRRSLTDSVLDEIQTKKPDKFGDACADDDNYYYLKVKQKLKYLHENENIEPNYVNGVGNSLKGSGLEESVILKTKWQIPRLNSPPSETAITSQDVTVKQKILSLSDREEVTRAKDETNYPKDSPFGSNEMLRLNTELRTSSFSSDETEINSTIRVDSDTSSKGILDSVLHDFVNNEPLCLDSMKQPSSDADVENGFSSKAEDGEDQTQYSDDGINIADHGLAIAFPVEHDQAFCFEPVFAEEFYAEDKKIIKNGKRNLWRIYIFLMVVVTAIAIISGAILGTKKKRSNDAAQDSTTIEPEKSQRETEIERRILSVSPEALNYGTYQSKALKWIVSEDKRQISPSDPSLLQRYILALFYFSTDGENWSYCSYSPDTSYCSFYDSSGALSNSYNFLSIDTECVWFGIICSNGIVSDIHLVRNGLQGSIPYEIGELDSLLILHLQKNSLTGEIPSRLGRLKNLASFDVLENSMTGTIPAELFSLNKLQKLNLASNKFVGSLSDGIGNLDSLLALYLFDNTLTGSLPKEIGSLGKLGQIWINNNNFSGTIPESIRGLVRLQAFYAQFNLFEGSIPSTIGSLWSLHALRLDHNNFEGTLPEEFFNLRALNFLTLYGNSFTGTLSSRFGFLTKLNSLDLRMNQFKGEIPSAIGNCAKLTHAFLHYNNFSGTMPESICELRDRHLERLSADCLEADTINSTLKCDCCTSCCDAELQQCWAN